MCLPVNNNKKRSWHFVCAATMMQYLLYSWLFPVLQGYNMQWHYPLSIDDPVRRSFHLIMDGPEKSDGGAIRHPVTWPGRASLTRRWEPLFRHM